jgi:hypothetical protein
MIGLFAKQNLTQDELSAMLNEAVSQNREDLVKVLLESSADPNSVEFSLLQSVAEILVSEMRNVRACVGSVFFCSAFLIKQV